MRSALSRGVYRGLVALRAPQLARRLRPGAPVLCFHNVVPGPEAGLGDASLHMPIGVFESTTGWLASEYEIVPLLELTHRLHMDRSVRGLAAITFDDAYTGVFVHALPMLASRGLPCTILVVTGFSNQPVPTWWDTLASRGLLSGARREEALSAHRGLARSVLTAAGDRRAPELPDLLLPASWERIVRATGDLVTLGSHTVGHPNLTALANAELEEELVRSRREIHERTGRDSDVLAYPYGLWDSRVASAAGRAGYRVGLTLEGAPTSTGRNLLRTPRLNVPASMSLDALACQAAGIHPRKLW